MRHGKKHNHLGRKTAHRKAMLANMESSRADICRAMNVSDVTLYRFEKGTTKLHRRSFLRIKRFIEEVERRVGKLEIQ